ncbi:MAG: ABC transporter permease [Halothiobacillaceae bacterium]
MNLVRIALVGLLRELRSGLLNAMLLALAVAVAAVTAVGFFTDRVERGMQAQAAEFLAADARVSDARPLDTLEEKARALGLDTARTLSFPTVIQAGDNARLVSLKAVDGDYPLRGQLARRSLDDDGETVAAAGPPPGEAWVDARLVALLELEPGDSVVVGNRAIRVTSVLTREPDIGSVFQQPAPRLMMNLADIEDTGLVTSVSRVRHALLLAVPDEVDARSLDALEASLSDRQRLERPSEAQPEFESAFERAAQFLGLSAVVAVLLAGAALLLAARHYNRVQQDSAALMRAFGATSRAIAGIYLLRLTLLALVAAVPGLLVGYLTQFGLSALMGRFLSVDLPPPGWMPVLVGTGIALIALYGFALPALLRLKDTPPLRVLKRDLGAPPPAAGLLLAVGLAAVGLLVLIQSRDLALAGWVFFGVLAALGGMFALSFAVLTLLRRLPGTGTARLGIARLARYRIAGAAQLTAIGLGLTALLLLGVVRVDLLQAWQTTVPEDAPNHFVINIQPDEVEPLRDFLARHGLSSAGFYPMLRARLTHIGERPVHVDEYEDGRARRLAEREFNLSWASSLPEDNRVLAGDWSDEGFSIEEGIGQTLGFGLGDVLTFEIDGEPVTAPVTSVRSVQWDSMRPNFFVMAPPALLSEFPAQHITSFYQPRGQEGFQRELLAEFPTLTVFDLNAILSEVRLVIDRASKAVEYVFLFTIAAGLVVLFAAFQATRGERLREAALLRVLGATRRQIARALWLEYLLVGLLAAIFAILAAGGLGAVLSINVFDLPLRFDWRLPLYGLLGGLLLMLLAVPPLLRKIVHTAPARAIRGG